MGAARLTQQVVESLQEGASAARMSQQVVEALTEGTAAARMSQQVVEVLMKTGNWARLSQQYLEVLTNAPINRDASDTLTITEDNDFEIVGGIDADFTDTLELTEDNSYTRMYERGFADTIVFSEAFDPITFGYDREAEDTLTITEDNDFEILPTVGYIDTIVFTEETETLIIPLHSASDTLTITETYGRQLVYTRDAYDAVGISETNDRDMALLRSATDTVVFTEKFFGEYHDADLTDTLTLTETYTSLRVLNRSASDTLTLTEIYGTANVLYRELIDSIPILESIPTVLGGLTIVIPAYVGTVVGACDATRQRYCVLRGINYTVTLPNPQFDDSETNMDTLQVFRTQTNRRIITVKRQAMRTLNYTFRLTRQKAIELRNFIRAEIDNQITLENWKGETWVGTIGTNPFAITADGRWGPCTEGMSVELELKAVRTH